MVVNVESLRLFTNIILKYFERFLPKSSVVLVVTFFTVQQLVMGYKKMDFDLNYFILTAGKGALLPLGLAFLFLELDFLYSLQIFFFISENNGPLCLVQYFNYVYYVHLFRPLPLLAHILYVYTVQRERADVQIVIR